MSRADWVELGRVTGLFGVQGWVKVFSDTRPREGLLEYRTVYVGREGDRREMQVATGQRQGKGIALKFAGVDDRDAAATLVGSAIWVRREQLPAAGEGEYYWVDLVGLRVVTLAGEELGRIERLFETGANDVMVIRGDREHLVPFVRPAVVRDVDLAAGVMRVDWDPDF